MGTPKRFLVLFALSVPNVTDGPGEQKIGNVNRYRENPRAWRWKNRNYLIFKTKKNTLKEEKSDKALRHVGL